MRRHTAVFSTPIGAMVFCAALDCNPAAAAIKIAVSYTFVEVEVSPISQTHRVQGTHYYVLQGRSVTSTNNVGADDGGEIGVTRHAATVSGAQYAARFKVLGKNKLVETTQYKSYTITTTIQTNGSDSCSASRIVKLKPGHQVFEDTRISNHDHMIVSDLHFEDINCKISE